MSRRPLFAMSIAVVMLTASLMSDKTPLLVWNASPSVPGGLYAIDRASPRLGDLVLVRLSARLATFAAHRRYLPCGALLIKPVAALAGDTVCRRDVLISVHGKLVARAHPADRAGRPLPSWHGCQIVPPGQVFLLSAHPDGFDSRYFGALPIGWVVGRAILVWPRIETK